MGDERTHEIALDDGQVRDAVPADGPALCALFAGITMEADLELAVERDPDFFALYALHGGPAAELRTATFVMEVAGRIEAMGTLLARTGYLHGERARVGYAGDLRLSRRVRGGRFLGHHFGPAFAHCAGRVDCEVALTAVIASNHAAIRALTERSDRYPSKPAYQLLRRFTILNIQLTLPRRPRPSAFGVTRASEAEVPEIASFLAADYGRRPFGEVMDEATLRWRLAHWPGLAIDDFYLARDAEGRLVGVVAAWDAQPIKRYRVRAWRGKMRWIRAAGNALAWALRAPRLPGVGGQFRYFYLTHQAIAGEDPAIMAALVDRVYADHRRTGHHFFSVCVLADDPLAPAYRRFQTTALAAGLYVMCAADSRWVGHDFGPGRPGFEMALV